MISMRRGLVYLYTGEGEGKTTNAIGLAIRAVGHGFRAIVVQFLKGNPDIGEYRVQRLLAPLYQVHQFGSRHCIDLQHPRAGDKKLAREALEFAKRALEQKPRILVLDEVNLAVAFGLVPKEEVLQLMERVPPETVLVLTGRRAPREFIERADLVTEMRLVKHPYQRGFIGRRGVEY